MWIKNFVFLKLKLFLETNILIKKLFKMFLYKKEMWNVLIKKELVNNEYKKNVKAKTRKDTVRVVKKNFFFFFFCETNSLINFLKKKVSIKRQNQKVHSNGGRETTLYGTDKSTDRRKTKTTLSVYDLPTFKALYTPGVFFFPLKTFNSVSVLN